MAKLELKSISKHYDGVASVDGLDLVVEHGEFLCLLGPSGCGKTTTLRLIAGFLVPDSGEIQVDSRVISSPSSVVPPERRNMSMLFQSYAIWPHMTVRQNVDYGLKMRQIPPSERRLRTDALLDATKLSAQAERYPAELSGGQQQRVALARALAPKPDILLLDEPLSNLDANLRGEMRFEIRRLHDEFKYTSVYVTHDQAEAMTMADRIVIMNAGRVEQVGSPREVYESPRSAFVARFIGGSNVLTGRHLGNRQVDIGGSTLQVGNGDFPPPGEPMSVCVKMHDLELLPDTGAGSDNTLAGVVRKHAYLGSHRDYVVDVGQEVLITASPQLQIGAGTPVTVRIPSDRCRGLIH